MRVYLDTCCYCRLFDDFSQTKVREEAAAVAEIISAAQKGSIEIVTSDVLIFELGRIKQSEKREKLESILSLSRHHIGNVQDVVEFAKLIRVLGATASDALHVASAFHPRADVFLTVDAKLIRICGKQLASLAMRFQNPLDFQKNFAEPS